MRRSRPSCPGFTLIELLAFLAVAIIALATGVPAFQSLAADNAITAGANDMVSHLQLARTTAIMRGAQTVLCPTADRRNCLDTIEWQAGFMLFTDENRNRRLDPGDELVRYHRMDPSRLRVVTSPGRKRLVYGPGGMAYGSTATITVCGRDGKALPKAVILSNTGRPRVSATRPDGSALRCG